VAGGVVYAGVGRKVYALSASTGHELWSYNTRGVIYSSPAVAGGVVYISAARASITMNGGVQGKVYALRASTGHKLWSHQVGAVISSAAVASGVVYIVSGTKKVYALDASTGHDLWSYRTGHADGSSPAVVNGKLYIGSGDHKVYAFDLPANANQAAARPRASRLKPIRSPRLLKGAP
jgi:outer membrane protein assembly factor BamB